MKCKACSSQNLELVVDMGSLPLAGDFHHGLDAQLYPLAIDHCSECGLLQVRDTVPHDVLFNDAYCYASSTVPALVEHFKEYASWIQQCLAGRPGKQIVLDIGANDGVLLRELDKLQIENVGLDASGPLVAKAHLEEGLIAVKGVFTEKDAPDLRRFAPNGYDLITCSNVFAHNADPNDFLRGVKSILKPDGIFVIEVHDSSQLYSKLQWDCFYHEHCFYWNTQSLEKVLQKNGFSTAGFINTPMHGGSLRVASTLGEGQLPQANHARLDWDKFGKAASRSKEVLRDVVESLSHTHHVLLHGAAGRATTLVNWSQIQGFIHGAYDGSPLRIGKHVPGTDIVIHDEKALYEDLEHTAYVLFGAWHLADSLRKKIKENCPNHQANFIVPLPYVKIL